MKSKLFILSSLFLLTIFHITFAEPLEVSFTDNFRYSQTPFFAEEDIRVYCTLQNNSGFDLQGVIYFYDNEKFIGKSLFSVANGRAIESWTDWRPSEGEHELRVKIFSLKKLEIAKGAESIKLEKEISLVKNTYIDIDTDGDKIGDKDDLDDDNDGFSDKIEIEKGMDPLVFNDAMFESISPNQKTVTYNRGDFKTNSKVAETLLENTKTAASAVVEKSKDLTEKTKIFLEEQKKVIDEKIEKDKTVELAQKELEKLSDKNSEVVGEQDKSFNLYTASIINAIPSLKEAYSFLLGVLIYILNSWWILLGVICLSLWSFWKLIQRRLTLRRF